MKNRYFVNFFLCLALLISNMSLATLNVEARSTEGINLESMVLSETISPRSDEIVVVYSKDGRYKRYYNKTTGQWIGDWIKIS